MGAITYLADDRGTLCRIDDSGAYISNDGGVDVDEGYQWGALP